MLHMNAVGDYLALDAGECRNLGHSLAERYRNAEPFPYVVIDDFLDPDVLRTVATNFPSSTNKQYFDRQQERLKYQYQPHQVSSGLVRNLFAELNSQAFLGFLEEMTGVAGLIPDPHFEGGGLHETKRGGHLGVHADFNIHDQLRLERRLNLLIYLNEDWEEDFGGQLELWNKDMSQCAVRVDPIFGRAVIFSTDLDSFHGHPDPLNCPPDRSRRSIATYYYSAAEAGLAALPNRTTNFRPRPGSGDKTDWEIRRYHFVNDWVPPKLQRLAHRLFG
jgi:Rps23 Pro-64 3,4-dihydroxylase Tpa1-like proline 4-hydroxylase